MSSLQRVLIAVGISILIGVPTGLAMGWSKKAKALIGPIFEFLRPIPPIAWIPLVILWFGVGEMSKVFLVTIGAIIPIIMNTFTGVKLVNPIFISVGRVYKASNVQILKEIVMPAATPAIFAGIKTAVSSGWMIVLAAEMMASKSGVGFLITRGMESYDVAMIIC
ncbi:MAG: ABC transporter permease, partial [Angelakisella sp.]